VAAIVVITTILLLHHKHEGSATTSRSNIVVQGQQEGGDGEGNTAQQQTMTTRIPRQQRLVANIFEQLGPLYTHRTYRMTGRNSTNSIACFFLTSTTSP
jgi:hypothetical protein